MMLLKTSSRRSVLYGLFDLPKSECSKVIFMYLNNTLRLPNVSGFLKIWLLVTTDSVSTAYGFTEVSLNPGMVEVEAFLNL